MKAGVCIREYTHARTEVMTRGCSSTAPAWMMRHTPLRGLPVKAAVPTADIF
jgi:hypothetical protein